MIFSKINKTNKMLEETYKILLRQIEIEANYKIKMIIKEAHSKLIRIKGLEYAPTANEIQTEIDKSLAISYYQNLFNYLSDQHGICLLQSEMQEIIDIVNEMQKGENMISDEEIEEYADGYFKRFVDDRMYEGFLDGAKWYREQLKIKKTQ